MLYKNIILLISIIDIKSSKIYLLWVPFHWLKRNWAVVSLSVLYQSSLDKGGLIYGKSPSSAITKT